MLSREGYSNDASPCSVLSLVVALDTIEDSPDYHMTIPIWWVMKAAVPTLVSMSPTIFSYISITASIYYNIMKSVKSMIAIIIAI